MLASAVGAKGAFFMYCVKCGVELADTEKVCPLCATAVYHPDISQPEGSALYPADRLPPARKLSRGYHIVAAAAFLLPLLLVLMADLQENRTVTWSGYVIGALLVSYVCVVLPLWFRKPNPVIFVPCGFAAGCLFLLYVDLFTRGGWFLTFAFPVLGGLGLLVTATVTLTRYIKKGKLYIAGGTVIVLGGLTLMTELLMNHTFGLSRFVGWSLYPLVTLILLGGILIFLAICRSARLVMERKFFI